MQWTSEARDAPRWAPPDFADLAPMLRIDPGDETNGLWMGSGFALAEHPVFAAWADAPDALHAPAHRCAHCWSEDTLCIYLRNVAHDFGADAELELRCAACGGITAWVGQE